MALFFSILTHIIIVAGIIAIYYFIYLMIIKMDNTVERIIRLVSLTTGFLIYIGAKAIGISIPELMLGGLSITNPFTVGIWGIIFPWFLGTIVAWYCIRELNKNEDIATRLIILITSFIVVMFGDVYVVSYQIETNVNGLNLSLLPNLTFTIGLSLYVIFKYHGSRKSGFAADTK